MCKVDHTKKVSEVQVPQHEVLEYMDLVAFQQEQKPQRSKRQGKGWRPDLLSSTQEARGPYGLFKNLFWPSYHFIIQLIITLLAVYIAKQNMILSHKKFYSPWINKIIFCHINKGRCTDVTGSKKSCSPQVETLSVNVTFPLSGGVVLVCSWSVFKSHRRYVTWLSR